VSAPAIRIAVYGEIDMNVIDGSSVWLQSVAQMLPGAGAVHVILLLRCAERRDVLTAPLRAHPAVEIVDPGHALGGAARLTPAAAAGLLEHLDEQHRFDLVLLRGAAVVDEVLGRGRFDGRIWLYYIPPHGSAPGADAARVRRLVPKVHRILCQTEAIRARLAQVAPQAAPKLAPLPPMIPALEDPEPAGATGPVQRLFYAGKLAPEYFFLEMVELFTRFRARQPTAVLDVAGDKIHNPADDPGFRPAAERALAGTDGLVWHGPVPREEVRALVRRSDVALSIRHPRLDASAELSTKVLEYGAGGCAVLLNRTAAHEELLGADYPLLASDLDEALAALTRASEDAELRLEAARRCYGASRRFTFDEVAAGLRPHLPSPAVDDAGSRPRVLFAGHDLKFLGDLPRWVTAGGGAVRENVWWQHNRHDEDKSEEDLGWADTILCEWCLGNAVWFSRAKRSHQRLVVRFHRMELETRYPGEIEFDHVDAVVFVARHVQDMAQQRFGWPAAKLRVVPNAIDVDSMALPKLPGSEFNLGMLGFVPALKRLDRTLDLLEGLRARDRRYRLIVKGRAPWDFAWMLRREEERRRYDDVYARISASPLLREAVTFEPFGNDVPAFMQKISHLVSCSDIEGHSVAVGEGMASGAVPVILDRPGARDQYTDRWVHGDSDAAARWILESAASGEHLAERERARAFALRWAPEVLAPVWHELLALESPDRAAPYSS
jgi:glycosyltransferase involved in cell wall biosynthesis